MKMICILLQNHPKKHDKNKQQTSKSKDKEEKSNKNIRNMLLNMPTKKKKEEDIKIEEDELLGDILGKLQAKPKQVLKPLASAPKKTFHSDAERNPFMKRGTGIKKMVKHTAAT